MTDYYQKYLKYKQKYLNEKTSLTGGNIIKLNEENISIEKITTNKELTTYKETLIELTRECEPEDEFNPVIEEPYEIFWILKYKETGEVVGYLKSTDLELYKHNENFELVGGIPDKKGLQISGACNGIPKKYSGLATLLLNAIELYSKENDYEYILLHAGTTREYLIGEGERKGLYIKNGFEKVRVLKAGEGDFANIDLWIMIKYLQQTGGKKNQKMILVDGTSSAGKTTICNYFSQKNFKCFQIDNYFSDKRINFNKLLKNVKNNYGEADKIYDFFPVKYMIDDALKSGKNFLLDHISQKEIIEYMKIKKLYNNLFIINVFTNINNLARNLESRRKEGDSRGIFAFKQFSERYIKTTKDDKNKIEKINRSEFRKILLKFFKYEFKNEDMLNEFCESTFKTMNIFDDKDHYIKLRDEFICDYLLITTDKTKEDIYKELEEKLILF